VKGNYSLYEMAWTPVTWLRTGISGRLLWTQ